ncbi:MAG: sulfite exporter TauE/SafE family protein [Planctomycetes bacterium]|nr:sulfite exporter TauE/SafE family protein [Planctomycetota bacterium]
MPEIDLSLGLLVTLIAFTAEYIDSTLGMGYGTTLLPILLLMKFDAKEIVPMILLSELISGLLAGVLHHKAGNVDLAPRRALADQWASIRERGLARWFVTELPMHLKVALVLGALSVVGAVGGATVFKNMGSHHLKICFGILIVSIGVVILATLKKQIAFSWKKIAGLGLLASFNKGFSGGGYGPVVMGGQMLSGIESKSAVGITSVAEGITCIAGLAVHMLWKGGVQSWKLAPFLLIGAILSVPCSAYSVKRIPAFGMRVAVGIVTVFLGLLTLNKELHLLDRVREMM